MDVSGAAAFWGEVWCPSSPLLHTHTHARSYPPLFLHSCPLLHKGINSPPTPSWRSRGGSRECTDRWMDGFSSPPPSGLFKGPGWEQTLRNLKKKKKKGRTPLKLLLWQGPNSCVLLDGGDHTGPIDASTHPLVSLYTSLPPPQPSQWVLCTYRTWILFF